MKRAIFLFLLLFCPSLAAWGAPITVQIVDATGAPLAGATVEVQRFDGVEPRYAVALSDAGGTASYDIEPLAGRPDFFGRVVAWKAGYAVAGTMMRAGTLKLTLPLTASVSGQVQSANGPIAGATVQLQSARGQGNSLFLLPDSSLAEKLSARTNDNGKFTLDGVPAAVDLQLRVADARYVTQIVAAKAGQEVSVETKPGATLRGRVLGVNGEPVAGLEVLAQSQSRSPNEGYATARTEANGDYQLTGLAPGLYNVLFNAALTENYVVAAIEGAAAVEGATDIGTARAVEGVVVRGRVVNATSGAGIEGIRVGTYGPIRPASSAAVTSITTDASGVFTVRVAPGSNRFYVMGAEKWLQSNEQQTLQVSAGKDVVGPTFELKAAPLVSGRVVNQAGEGVAISLVARQNKNYREWPFQSQANGDFQLYGPAEGDIEIGFSRFAMGEPSEWEVVSVENATLPSAAPLRVVVKPAQFGSITGRAVDENGAPLADVKVDLTLMAGQGEGAYGRFETLTSDANGRVEFARLRANQTPTLRSVSKADYDLVSGGELKRENGAWVLAAITMKKRVGQIAGRVRRSDDAPAAGALVFAGTSETRADQNGDFTLKNLPAGALRVVAFSEGEFAFEPANGAANRAINLRLAPQTLQPTDRELADEFFDRARVLAATTNYYAKEQLKLSAPDERARQLEELIARPRRDALARRAIYAYASDENLPFELLRRAVVSLDDPGWRLYSAGRLFSKRPAWPDDAATRAWVAALVADAAQISGADANQGNKWVRAIGLFGLAPIIEQFEGEAAFTRARDWVWKEFPAARDGNTPSRDETLVVMGEMLAATSPRLFARLLDDIPAASEGYSRALREGSLAIARARGLEAAVPFLKRLENAPSPRADERGNRVSVEGAWGRATREAIAAGGARSPALALQLATALPTDDGNFDDERPRALAEAAFFQSPAVAAAIWEKALPQLSATRAVQYAVRIAQTNPVLGRAQLEAARVKLSESQPNSWPVNSVAAFAFYEARLDPARAYYRLEKEWSEPSGEVFDRVRAQGDLVRAMASIDGERAFEWALQIPNAGDARNEGIDALRKAAQWIEADEGKRARVDFEMWDRNGTAFGD